MGKSPLEGWRFLPEATNTATAYQSQTFEGLYEWQFHTLAYAENEWANATPWNAPSSATLAPGETRTYGLQFNLAPSIREIEETLQAVNRPVAVGIPGYIVPMDQQAKLFVDYPSKIQSISVSPSGALSWTTNSDALSSAWAGYTLTGHTWGRSRLTITYEDGTVQTVHYYVTKAATSVISDLGNFLTTEQWFDNSSDPFRRSPAVITYDREANAIVRDDPRAWIPGLSDEAGAGSWLAATMKQFAQPNAQEVAKLEQFINQTLWGSIQNSDGSVKKVCYPSALDVPEANSLLFSLSTSISPTWSRTTATQVPSTGVTGGPGTKQRHTRPIVPTTMSMLLYVSTYTHTIVTNLSSQAAYWALYRVARNYPSLVKVHTWQWYLNQAVLTVERMTAGDVGYATDGLMDETVIRFLLDDLKREGLTANASLIESRMEARTQLWATERFPYVSVTTSAASLC